MDKNIENNEINNALLIQLAELQQKLRAKESEIKTLEQENADLKKGIIKPEKTSLKGITKYYLKSGELRFKFSIYNENGIKKKYSGFKTQTEAERERRTLLKLRDEQKLVSYIKNQKLTYDDLYNQYLTFCKANNYAPTTISAGIGLYENHLKYFFSEMKISEITKTSCQDWAVEIKELPNFGPSAYNNTLKKAKAIWNCALKNDVITLPNPFNVLKPIDITKEKETRTVRIDREEGELLIIAAKNLFNDYTAPMIACGIYAGIREGEVLGLKWSDIDFKESTINIQRQVQRITKKELNKKLSENSNLTADDILITERLKTKASRAKIGVPKRLIKELEIYKQSLISDGRVYELCFTNDGHPLNSDILVDQRFEKVLQVVFDDPNYMTFHQLRGSCATILHKEGVPSKVIQRLLRHSKVSITEDNYIDLKSTSEYAKSELDRVFH